MQDVPYKSIEPQAEQNNIVMKYFLPWQRQGRSEKTISKVMRENNSEENKTACYTIGGSLRFTQKTDILKKTKVR